MGCCPCGRGHLSWGDFNLVRFQWKKSTGNINFTHSTAFKEWINEWGLIEIKDPSRCFTWSNNQKCHVMVILDRVFSNMEWDAKYPMSTVNLLPKSVSDHNPLLIQFGEKRQMGDPMFRFEKWWLEIDGFAKVVKKAWEIRCPTTDPMEVW
jgi:hypothetical protein